MNESMPTTDPIAADDEAAPILDRSPFDSPESPSEIDYALPRDGWPNGLYSSVASQDVEGTRAALEAGLDPICSKNNGASPLVLALLANDELSDAEGTEFAVKAAEILKIIQGWIIEKKGGNTPDHRTGGLASPTKTNRAPLQ